MSFGVNSGEPGEGTNPERKIVQAVTTETIVALIIVSGIFAVFIWRMGVAFTFKTAMETAHDLILNTVLFLMGVIVLAGAFTSLISVVTTYPKRTIITTGSPNRITSVLTSLKMC